MHGIFLAVFPEPVGTLLWVSSLDCDIPKLLKHGASCFLLGIHTLREELDWSIRCRDNVRGWGSSLLQPSTFMKWLKYVAPKQTLQFLYQS